MIGIVIVAVGLAAYRATRAVTTDTISAGLRRGLLRRFPSRARQLHDDAGRPVAGTAVLVPRRIVELVNCAWCTGFWAAGAGMLTAHAVGLADNWGWVLVGWWAAATIVGLVDCWVERS